MRNFSHRILFFSIKYRASDRLKMLNKIIIDIKNKFGIKHLSEPNILKIKIKKEVNVFIRAKKLCSRIFLTCQSFWYTYIVKLNLAWSLVWYQSWIICLIFSEHFRFSAKSSFLNIPVGFRPMSYRINCVQNSTVSD